jgi:hypothetical protein
MKKAALLSIPVVVAVVVVGDLAEAQQLKKVPRIGFLFGSPFPLARPASSHSARGSSILVAAVLLVVAFIAEAQQPTKVPRIGFLSLNSPAALAARIEAFRQGLRELGYEEGKNIVIEWRSGEGKLDRLPAPAAELVHLKVNIIVTSGPSATRPAKEATSSGLATGIPERAVCDIGYKQIGFGLRHGIKW